MGENTFIFRVDASAGIGIGHLLRCLALASELRKMNCVSHFICRERFGHELELQVMPHILHWLADFEERLGNTSDEELHDADATLAIICDLPSAGDWVVLDSYRLAYHWEKRVRDAGHRLAVIEDDRRRRHCADLLVSDTETPFDRSHNELAGFARMLAGPKYAIVDSVYAYSEKASAAAARRKRILISYGGSDPTDETSKAVAAVRALKADIMSANRIGAVDVVIGPINPRAAAVICAAQGIPDVVTHQVVPSLAPLMRQADLILTAGGTSMIEALALRRPCIVTVTGENQTMMIAALEARGVIRSLGWHATVSPRHVQDTVADLLDCFQPFADNVISKPVFDHLGAGRILAAMLSATERVA
jgi:UDP-2,4-diacetamido-2,4,6-trideoxy-beta-L-altropyranose hydrolase